MKKIIFTLFVLFIFNITFTQDRLGSDVHKYDTYQALKLLEHQYPNYFNNSVLKDYLGHNG